MKKKLIRFIIGVLGIPFVAFIGFYVFVSLYYTKGFSFNTRINGIYCTGKSVEEVNAKLLENYTRDKVKICSDFGEDEYISLADLDYSADFCNSLKSIQENQNPWLWIFNSSKFNLKEELKPKTSFDCEKLYDAIGSLKIAKEYSKEREQIAEIRYSSEKGYYLYEDINKLLDTDELYEYVFERIKDFDVIEVPSELFKARTPSDEMLREKKIWREVASFFSTKIYYDMGAEVIPINSAVLSDFVVYDASLRDFVRNEDGSVFFDESLAVKYIDDLCDRYETYEKPRDLVTFDGVEKHIGHSVYGTLLDKKAEEQYFVETIKAGVSERHVPKYLKMGYVRGLDDIGDTYIEVDLTNQVMYFIKDGEKDSTFEIVSGRPSTGKATPEMIAYVYKKVPGKYLRGEDYCSYVNFWMPFHSHIGFHDASWQKKYGGDRYLTHGSHGCINMRYEDAEYLYNAIEVGIPVIVYK